MPPRRGCGFIMVGILQRCRAYGAPVGRRCRAAGRAAARPYHPEVARPGRGCKRGRNLEGGFLPNAATPKRTGRARRNSQFAIPNGQGFFSGIHFGMDGWGIWRLAVAERRNDNSPAFQCRVQSAKHPKSRRDDRIFQNEIMRQMRRRFVVCSAVPVGLVAVRKHTEIISLRSLRSFAAESVCAGCGRPRPCLLIGRAALLRRRTRGSASLPLFRGGEVGTGCGVLDLVY